MTKPSKDRDTADASRRLLTGLALVVLINGFAINFALPKLPWQAQQITTLDYSWAFFQHTAHADSWKAMRTALVYADADIRAEGTEPGASTASRKPLYQALYFDNNVRFQYPPSSLLVLQSLRAIGGDSFIGDTRLNFVSWLSIWLLSAVVSRIFFLARRSRAPASESSAALEISLGVLALLFTLTFYPVVRGYYLGQIQVWLDLLIAMVIWTWLEGRRGVSGAILSLICVIKPTFALVVVWGAVRRHWRFVAGFAVPMSVFAVLALAAFGFENHMDYLNVLSYISKQGEIFHPNQSMNGLLHRLLHNGNSLEWNRDLLVTFNPWVYGGTVLSSLALMGAGLYAARERGDDKRGLDLAVILVCATLASPTVWTHHYGVMLPIFALAVPAVLAVEPESRKRYLIWFLLCFALISNNYRALNRLSDTSLNFLQSYVYFGGLAFLALLVKLRSRRS